MLCGNTQEIEREIVQKRHTGINLGVCNLLLVCIVVQYLHRVTSFASQGVVRVRSSILSKRKELLQLVSGKLVDLLFVVHNIAETFLGELPLDDFLLYST